MKLRSIEDLDELEKLALINMSYSRLNTYELCPSMYFYTYIQKEDRLFGPPAVMGNVIHSVLEDKVGDELDYKELVELMHHYRDEYDPDKLIDKKLMLAGEEMLGEFVDRHKEDKFDIIEKEKEFQIIIGTARIVGYIDMIRRDANGLIIIQDYKSGKHEVTYKNIASNLQLGIYVLAAAQDYPDVPIYGELYYLRSGRRKGHLFQPQDMEPLHDEVLEKVNDIIHERNFNPTENARICSFCDFAKSGVCPTGKMRLRNKRY